VRRILSTDGVFGEASLSLSMPRTAAACVYRADTLRRFDATTVPTRKHGCDRDLLPPHIRRCGTLACSSNGRGGRRCRGQQQRCGEGKCKRDKHGSDCT
jgi:hypothetical protein